MTGNEFFDFMTDFINTNQTNQLFEKYRMSSITEDKWRKMCFDVRDVFGENVVDDFFIDFWKNNILKTTIDTEQYEISEWLKQFCKKYDIVL